MQSPAQNDRPTSFTTEISANELVPPPRFQQTSFATYRSQSEAQAKVVAEVQAFIARPKRRWPWQAKHPPGLYLDGDFGVGKTHLLASCWHTQAQKSVMSRLPSR